MTARPLASQPSAEADLPEPEPIPARMRRPRVPAHRRLGSWSWHSPVARTAVALIAGQLAVTTWVIARFPLTGDDVMLLGLGGSHPLGDPDLLLRSWGGHLMPGSFLLAQGLARIGGYSHEALVVQVLLGRLLIDVLCLRLLVRHFGLRWRIVVPFGLVVSSIALLQAASWWAAALNQLPFVICLIVAADRLLSWLTLRRPADRAWVIGATLAGLLFFEKAVLIAPLLLGLAVVVGPEPRWTTALRAALMRDRVLWLGLLLALGGWAVVYRLSATSEFAALPTPSAVSDLGGAGLALTALSSLLGGWPAWETTLLHPPAWLPLLAGQVLLVVVVWSCAASRRAARAWVLAGLYGLASLPLLAAGRGVYAPFTAFLPRYFGDAVVVLSLCWALATMRLLTDPVPAPEPALPSSRKGRTAVAAVAALTANLVLVNAVRTAAALPVPQDAAGALPYLSRVSAGLRTLGPERTVLDLSVNQDVLRILPSPQDRYSTVFSPIRGSARFATSATELVVITRDGEVGPGIVVGPSSDPDGPWCTSASSRVLAVPLEARIVPWTHVLRLDYISAADGTVTASMVPRQPADIPVRAGVGTVYAVVDGGGWVLTIDARGVPGSFCVRDATVGAALSATAG